MKTPHTAGPWKATVEGTRIVIRGPKGNMEGIIADVNLLRGDDGPANARLIAAAPDLLGALTACVKELKGWMKDHGEDRKTKDAIDQARAAIKKATQCTI